MDQPDDSFYRTYMGGGCLGAYYLLTEQGPKVDPFDPTALIVFAPSVVTGVPVPGFSRFSVVAKSPLNGLVCESQAGGFWGAELKLAGFDAVIVSGCAERSSYIWIHDGEVEIKDASHIWGMKTPAAQDVIRKELADAHVRAALIGPAGEKLVRFASILNEGRYANGRGGLGAVMGSKNLKALVVRGADEMEVADRDGVLELSRKFARDYSKNPSNSALHSVGTAGTVSFNNLDGQLPTRNFQGGVFEEADSISGEAIADTILQGAEGCFACPVRCKRKVEMRESDGQGNLVEGPEYETIAALGSNCGVGDLQAVVKANKLCDEYGLDTISTGSVIAFAMECGERGLLGQHEEEYRDLRFGNAHAMLALVEAIATRQGLGRLLGEGVRLAATSLGPGAAEFAMHARGRELPMHDPRGKGMLGLSYALSPIGADHGVVEHDVAFDQYAPQVYVEGAKPLGLLERLPREDVSDDKVRMFCYLQQHFSLLDTLSICTFTVAPVNTFTLTQLVQLVSAVTGWETSLWELMKVGERRVNMLKVFNLREESPLDKDDLPRRMFEPIRGGPRDGSRVDRKAFSEAVALYREMMNWDERGVPRRAKLVELNLGWLEGMIESCRQVAQSGEDIRG